MPECSGLRAGWLKGRKGLLEGWFPEDFVMPVLSETATSGGVGFSETPGLHEQSEADYANVSSCRYSNLPEMVLYVQQRCLIHR